MAPEYPTNLETTWYFKLNEDWPTGIPSRVPFITRSVQTFYLRYDKSLDAMTPKLHEFDCLRIGLSGNLGMTTYSTYIQYDLDQILVIPNRDELKAYEGFYQVDQHWHSKDFLKNFSLQTYRGEKPAVPIKSPSGMIWGKYSFHIELICQ